MKWAKRDKYNQYASLKLDLKTACKRAASSGELGVLKWLRNTGCPWDQWICAIAAKDGHLEMLQWAREHGCPWDDMVCLYAAVGGHLNVLQWLRAGHCPWDKWTCRAAAMYGHLELLQWARANGCPWEKSECAAVSRKHPKIRAWVRQQQPWDACRCHSGGRHTKILTRRVGGHLHIQVRPKSFRLHLMSIHAIAMSYSLVPSLSRCNDVKYNHRMVALRVELPDTSIQMLCICNLGASVDQSA